MLGSFLVNVGISFDASSTAAILKSLGLAAGIAAGAALQALAGAHLVRRHVGFPHPLDHERAVGMFLLLGGPVSCLVNATWATTVLYFGGAVADGAVAFSWLTWWVGDAIGVLVLTPLLLIWTAEPRDVWRSRRFSLALPLFVAFLATIAVFVRVSRWEQDRLGLEFRKRAGEIDSALTQRLADYLDLLHSVAALYESSVDVDRLEFRTFTRRIMSRHPGIRALSWNLLVSADQREALEAAARRDGFADFRVMEKDVAGQLVPAAARPQHVVACYVEPLAENAPLLGLDVWADSVRREAMELARNTGEAVATHRTTLVQDVRRQPALLVYQPIYGNGRPRSTLEERTGSLRGFVCGAFQIDAVVAAALWGLDTAGIDLRISEATGAGENELYRSAKTVAAAATAIAADMDLRVSREFAGRNWDLQVTASTPYREARRSLQAWSILAGGLLSCGILSAILLVITGRTSRMEALVRERTGELVGAKDAVDRQKRLLDSVLRNAGEGIVVADENGKFLVFNPAAEHILGRGATDADSRTWSETYGLFRPDRTTRCPDGEFPLARAIRGESCDAVELFVRHSQRPDGAFISVTGRPLLDEAGKGTGGVVTFRDVSEIKTAQAELARLATTDALTGLPNRRAYFLRLKALVDEAGRGRRFALVMIDIDHFKKLNDTHGHPAGDRVLIAVARALSEGVRKTDLVARIGGEEFAVLVTDLDEPVSGALAEKLRTSVACIQDPAQVTASLGIAIYRPEIGGAEDLMRLADLALYQAKESGRNRVVIHPA